MSATLESVIFSEAMEDLRRRSSFRVLVWKTSGGFSPSFAFVVDTRLEKTRKNTRKRHERHHKPFFHQNIDAREREAAAVLLFPKSVFRQLCKLLCLTNTPLPFCSRKHHSWFCFPQYAGLPSHFFSLCHSLFHFAFAVCHFPISYHTRHVPPPLCFPLISVTSAPSSTCSYITSTQFHLLSAPSFLPTFHTFDFSLPLIVSTTTKLKFLPFSHKAPKRPGVS